MGFKKKEELIETPEVDETPLETLDEPEGLEETSEVIDEDTPEVDETPLETLDEPEGLEETSEVIDEDTPEVDETPRESGEYIVVTSIKKGGKIYTPGEVIKFNPDSKEVKILIADGVIR